jgi:hypothetical protein
VLYVGGEQDWLRRHFGDVRRVATVTLDIDTPVANRDVPVWLCTDPAAPWPELWHRMHRP